MIDKSVLSNFSSPLKRLIEAQQRTVTRLWTIFTVAMLVYFFILYFVEVEETTDTAYNFLGYYLPYLSVALAIFSLLFFFRFNKVSRVKEEIFNRKKVKLTSMDQALFDRVLEGATLNEKELSFGQIIPYLQSRHFICWGINESIVFLGFIGTFFFNNNFYLFLPYLVSGISLNVYMYPNVTKIVEKIA